MLEKATNCYYIKLDRRLNLIVANEKYRNLFTNRLSASDTSFLSCFASNLQDEWIKVFDWVSANQVDVQLISTPISTEKEVLKIDWSVGAVEDSENTVTGFEILGVVVECEKLPLRALKAFYDSLFESNPSASWLLDVKGNLLKVNAAFQKITEYHPEHIAHTNFLSLIDPEDAGDAKKYFLEAAQGITQQFNTTLIAKGGNRIEACINYLPVTINNTVVGVHAFTKDITESTQEASLKLKLNNLKNILNSSLDMICAFDETSKFTEVSAACKAVLGYEVSELIGKNVTELLYKEDLQATIDVTEKIKSGLDTTNFENRYYRKDGSIVHLTWSSRWDAADKRFYSIGRDATEKKASEAALKASEEKYKILFYNHPLPTWIYDVETFRFVEVNEAAIEHYGFSREEFLNMRLQDILVGREVEKFNGLHSKKDFYERRHKGVWIHQKKNKEILYTEITSNYINFQGRRAKLVLSNDVTEQVRGEQELRKSNDRYVFLSEATFDAIWDWDVKTNEVQWNEGSKRMFKIDNLKLINKKNWWSDHLHPDDKERVETKLQNTLDEFRSHWEDEYRFDTEDGYKYIYDRGHVVYDEKKGPIRMIGAMQDLTERKAHELTLEKLNQSLERRARELAESNAELERFAYVASHDLQEPLRMVTSFLQLLVKRYNDKLDQKAFQYIEYAVDGAERMKRLILDLLEYSKVNSSKIEKEDVNVNDIVEELKLTYKNILNETGGSITNPPLPVVRGNKTQILQLFQNLISNAFKYKSEKAPVVDITFDEDNTLYKFAITDNGIGISPKFFHKIFIIFQRLHNREEYSGTGIGLAICKKIIDKHGGKIWVSSAPGQGSTFYFTIPKLK